MQRAPTKLVASGFMPATRNIMVRPYKRVYMIRCLTYQDGNPTLPARQDGEEMKATGLAGSGDPASTGWIM